MFIVQSQTKAIYLNLGSPHHKMKKQAVKISGAFRKINPAKSKCPAKLVTRYQGSQGSLS
jgi:hypothetical protein